MSAAAVLNVADHPTRHTRDRLLNAARELFLKKGYVATGIAEICAKAEARSGSLYHFFPTKQHLLIAVLEAYRDGIDQMLIEPAWQGVTDPIERVFALLGAYRHLLQESNFSYGCPIGSLALELREPDPPVLDLLQQNFGAWTERVRGCFEAARPRLSAGADAHALAVLVLTIMEGAVMQARVHHGLKEFDACIGELRKYVQLLSREKV